MSTLLNDTFTDVDGTLLTAHTMNTGPGWVNGNGTFKIVSNKATPNSNANDDMITSDAGNADVTLAMTVTAFGTAGNQRNPGIVLRYTDTTHLWLVDISPGTTNNIVLYENTGSGYTSRATGSAVIVSGTGTGVIVGCVGSVINVQISGNSIFTYIAASSNNTATKYGLRLGVQGAATACTWDDLLVTGTTPSAGGGNVIVGGCSVIQGLIG